MNLIDILIYVVIGLVVLGIIVGYTSGKFDKVNKVEEDLINKTLEDPFAITGDSVKESDLKSESNNFNIGKNKQKQNSFPYFTIHKNINIFSIL